MTGGSASRRKGSTVGCCSMWNASVLSAEGTHYPVPVAFVAPVTTSTYMRLA
jgi:hypothetical protein